MTALLEWFTPTRWIVLAVLALALLASFIGYGELRASQEREAVTARYEAAIARQKVEAAGQLASETRKVLELERQLTAARAAQEVIDADNANTVAALRADLRRKSRAAGGPGLRDPYAAGCGGGGGGTPAPAAADPDGRAADGAEAGGLVSQPLEELLLELIDAGEQINLAYTSCRVDLQAVRRLISPNTE